MINGKICEIRAKLLRNEFAFSFPDITHVELEQNYRRLRTFAKITVLKVGVAVTIGNPL